MSDTPDTAGPPGALAQAVLTLDLDALCANWRNLRQRAAPAECAAVVKADAYGIGIEPAVRALAAAGCRTFFVAQTSEGARVRAALGGAEGFTIYALNGVLPGQASAQAFRDHGLSPVIGSMDEFRAWLAAPDVSIALQFNTGMNRLGIDAKQAGDVREALASARVEQQVGLVMSHFVSSEAAGDPVNDTQIAAFEKIRALFSGFRTSIANSSGIFLAQQPYCDLVRPGYALYGGNPTPGLANPMLPVVQLHAPVIQVREVEAGATVGYNAQWTARRRSRLAVLGLGYADGIPRSAMWTPARPGAEAIIAGVRCPFAGRVSMDLIVIDATDVPELARGVMAEIIGAHTGVDDFAERAGTIGYEILTGLGHRYHRVYLSPRHSW